MRLNRNQLKYVVIAAMLLDHIAWAFFDTFSFPGLLCHFIGRLTGPTMAFFLAEGYLHTGNVRRYLLRLGLFALLSWIPFSLFEVGYWPSANMGVIYTLFLGLLSIVIWERTRLSEQCKRFLTVCLLLASFIGDWPVFDVVFPLLLVRTREEPEKRSRLLTIFCLCAAVGLSLSDSLRETLLRLVMNGGMLLVPPLLTRCYNGEPGSRHPFHKWFFYLFYPLHLLVLWYLKACL